MLDTKVCPTCGEEKPLTDFYKSARTYCKKCFGIRNVTYRRENRERNAQVVRAWAKAHPEKIALAKRRHRLKERGLTFESFEALLASQGGQCAICRSSEPGGGGPWAVDHDHACCPSEKSCSRCVRGLLCSNCNRALGFFKDDPEILALALKYLAKHTGT